MITKLCKSCNSEKSIDKFYDINKKSNRYRFCKECDNIRTRSIQQKLRSEINSIKELRGCCICGEKNSIVLDFHHIDPTKKDRDISELVKVKSRKRIMNEICKCVVVCANHHRLIEANQVVIPTEVLEKYNLGIAQLVEQYTL